MRKIPRNINVLLGKTVVSIVRKYDEYKGDSLVFTTTDGKKYLMSHHQICCEEVELHDVTGDFFDLEHMPILMAEEVTGESTDTEGRFTWTFYKFATEYGFVTLRWYGESNGNYSEKVNFDELVESEGNYGYML